MFRNSKIASIYRIILGLVLIALYLSRSYHGNFDMFSLFLGVLLLGFGIYGLTLGKKAAEKDMDNLAAKIAEKLEKNKTDKI